MIQEDYDDIDDDSREIADDNCDELYEHFRFVADKGQQLLRVDKFLTARIEKSSRNRIQQAAEAGCILVNGKAVKSNYRVKPLDVVTVVMDRPRVPFPRQPRLRCQRPPYGPRAPNRQGHLRTARCGQDSRRQDIARKTIFQQDH